MPITLGRRPNSTYHFVIFHTSLGSIFCTKFELKRDWTVEKVPSSEDQVIVIKYITLNMFGIIEVWNDYWSRRYIKWHWNNLQLNHLYYEKSSINEKNAKNNFFKIFQNFLENELIVWCQEYGWCGFRCSVSLNGCGS